MLGHVAPGQDAAVDLRVERLHPAVEHLGKPGDLRHVAHGTPASRSSFAVPPVERISIPSATRAWANVDDPRLVVHADQSSPDLHRMLTLRAPRPSSAPLGEQAERPRDRAGAPREDTRGQRLLGVVGQHGHRRLQDDRPGVHGPSSTKCTVAPVTFAPCSSAWRWACRPGNAGSSEGGCSARGPGRRDVGRRRGSA